MCTHVSATLKIERNQIHSETLFPLKKTIFELENEDKLRFNKYAISFCVSIESNINCTSSVKALSIF